MWRDYCWQCQNGLSLYVEHTHTGTHKSYCCKIWRLIQIELSLSTFSTAIDVYTKLDSFIFIPLMVWCVNRHAYAFKSFFNELSQIKINVLTLYDLVDDDNKEEEKNLRDFHFLAKERHVLEMKIFLFSLHHHPKEIFIVNSVSFWKSFSFWDLSAHNFLERDYHMGKHENERLDNIKWDVKCVCRRKKRKFHQTPKSSCQWSFMSFSLDFLFSLRIMMMSREENIYFQKFPRLISSRLDTLKKFLF